MNSQNGTAQSNEAARNIRTLKKQVRAALTGHGLENLIRMDCHQQNRLHSEIRMPYENFGDFHRKLNPQSIAPFSREELLVISVIDKYAQAQLSSMLRQLEQVDGVGYWEILGFLLRCIDDNYETLVGMLRKKWPQEFVTILSRNSKLQTPT